MPVARIAYRDQVILFPAVDDPERVARERTVDNRVGFSQSGQNESSMILAFDQVRIEVADVVTEAFLDELEAWWSHARRGVPYTFSFDDTDRVLTAIDADAAAGATVLDVSSLDGIVAGRKYFLVQDLMGRNLSRNLLASLPSLCEDAADYTIIGSPTITQVGSPKQGTFALKMDTILAFDAIQSTIATAIPKEGFVTFSLWYKDLRAANTYRLSIIGGSKTVTALISDASPGVFRRFQVTGFFPDGASNIVVNVESTTAVSAEFITVDAWQVEFTQHATPWRDGVFTDPAGTLSTQGFTEVVTVDTIAPPQVTLAAPLKFSYKARDAFKSFRHWERVVSLDSPTGPLRDKLLTRTFRNRFREVP